MDNRFRNYAWLLLLVWTITLLFAGKSFAQITVRPDHPRIWINAENIDEIRNRNSNGGANPYWLKIKAIADNPPGDTYIFQLRNYPTIGELYDALQARLPRHWQPSFLAGYAFWNGGFNWAPVRGTKSPQRLQELLGEAGKWRIEIMPVLSQKRDYFLHLLSFTGLTVSTRLEEDDELATITIIDPEYIYIISLNKIGEIGGHITISTAYGERLVDKPFKRSQESLF